jgi:prepilin-type N-terminal cleavage/methylation domain-containing protein
MKAYVVKTSRSIKAFTLVELLIALMVTGIILSAVATLAYAMSSASRDSDDTVAKEAQLRQARLRIAELVGQCQLICAAPGNDLAIWQADTIPDGQINVGELIYIERGDGHNILRLCRFPATDSAVVTLAQLNEPGRKALLVAQYSETYVPLIPACEHVEFTLGKASDEAVPFTRWLTIAFDLAENGAVHPYEMTETLRAWAGNRLNGTATALVSDDD